MLLWKKVSPFSPLNPEDSSTRRKMNGKVPPPLENKCFTFRNTVPGYLWPRLAFIYLEMTQWPTGTRNQWACIMNTLSLIHFHDVKLSCQPSASDGPRNDEKHPHAFLISSLKAGRKSLYASDCPSSETGNNVGAGNVNVTGGGRFS